MLPAPLLKWSERKLMGYRVLIDDNFHYQDDPNA